MVPFNNNILTNYEVIGSKTSKFNAAMCSKQLLKCKLVLSDVEGAFPFTAQVHV